MLDTHHANTEVGDALFEKLGSVRAGMLGVDSSAAHMQPMTHFVDSGRERLWFITSRQTDLASDIGLGGSAHYCVVDADDGYYACLRGAIRQSEDTAKVDELWSPVVAAWFSGRDDPNVLLIELTLRDAEIWTATDSATRFGFEIAKANVKSDSEPDVGTRHILTF